MNKQAMILTINLPQLIKGTDTCKNEPKHVYLYSTCGEATCNAAKPQVI